MTQECDNAAITTAQIDLPPFGMTVLPPWGQAIVLGKPIENRGAFVLQEIGGYRGPIVLSQSAWKREHYYYAQEEWKELVFKELVARDFSSIADDVRNWAGNAFAVAILKHVMTPLEARSSPWSEPGMHGLELADVFRIEPVPCSGGTGFWMVQRCEACRRIGAGLWMPSANHACKECWRRSKKYRGKVRVQVTNDAQLETLRTKYGWCGEN